MAGGSNNWFSVMRSDEGDSSCTESDFHYSEDEEDSDYSGYSSFDISEVDFEIKVFEDVTKFLDQFDRLELEEEIKSRAKSKEDPTLNNKKVSEDKMETNMVEEETTEDINAPSEIPGEDRKTEHILPEVYPQSCSSLNQVVFLFLFFFLFSFSFLFLFSFLFSFPLVVFPLLHLHLLILLQEHKRLHDIPLLEEGQEGSKRLRLGDPGDCYHADTKESDLD